MKLEFSGRIFENYSSTEFHFKKPIQWEPIYSMRTDGHKYIYDEANVSFLQFWDRT